jgi:hypothetical protein
MSKLPESESAFLKISLNSLLFKPRKVKIAHFSASSYDIFDVTDTTFVKIV